MHRLAFALLLVLSGCSLADPSVSPVRFTTDAAVYAPGETVRARLENGSRADVAYNLGCATLEVLDGTWQHARGASDRVPGCAFILYTLRPGESAETSFQLSQEVASGSYRVTSNVGSPAPVAPFEVR